MLELQPGDPARLGDHLLLGRLGEGGQGTVFLGEGPYGRVAVKLLHARLSGDALARARFVRELATIRRIAGFCTARVYASDLDGDQPYIVSEYVPGPSLHELVGADGPRTEGALMRLAVGTATALTAIHRAGVVHRDFKPPNVLMGPDGPRVIDFGIARALDHAGRTVTGPLAGTPAFMAPEQFAAEPVGPAADLFSWAGTMVFAATGRRPFGSGQVYAVIHRVRHAEPDLAGLPDELVAPVSACLAKDPALRPTANELLWDLLGQGPPTETAADPPPPVELAPAGPADPTSDLDGRPREPRSAGPARPVLPGRPLRRGPALRAALLLSVLVALLDMAVLAVAAGRPAASDQAQWILVLSLAYTSLAVVTLFGVAAAWRGHRSGAWTIIAARLVRAAVWTASLGAVAPVPGTIALQAASPALIVVLLLFALRR